MLPRASVSGGGRGCSFDQWLRRGVGNRWRLLTQPRQAEEQRDQR
jgi:hypothetical protein